MTFTIKHLRKVWRELPFVFTPSDLPHGNYPWQHLVAELTKRRMVRCIGPGKYERRGASEWIKQEVTR